MRSPRRSTGAHPPATVLHPDAGSIPHSIDAQRQAAASGRRLASGLWRRARSAAGYLAEKFGRGRPPPRLPLCGLATSLHYEDATWRGLHEDLATYSFDNHVFLPEIYRKGWEWTQTIWGLQQLGMLDGGARAIGVGAGRESVIFWLADHLGYVLATDLLGNKLWSAGREAEEADAAILADPQGLLAPSGGRPPGFSFLPMNGLHLTARDESFDIAWSLSSIEHFGGHEAAAQAVAEMAQSRRAREA